VYCSLTDPRFAAQDDCAHSRLDQDYNANEPWQGATWPGESWEETSPPQPSRAVSEVDLCPSPGKSWFMFL
jgi:hypothetical protein